MALWWAALLGRPRRRPHMPAAAPLLPSPPARPALARRPCTGLPCQCVGAGAGPTLAAVAVGPTSPACPAGLPPWHAQVHRLLGRRTSLLMCLVTFLFLFGSCCAYLMIIGEPAAWAVGVGELGGAWRYCLSWGKG